MPKSNDKEKAMGDSGTWRAEADARLDKVEAAIDLLSRLLTTAEDARSTMKRAGRGVRAISTVALVGAVAVAAVVMVGKRQA